MTSQLNNLLIDLGNTRFKWGIGNEYSIVSGVTVPNVELNQAKLLELWQGIQMPGQIGIACVGGKAQLDCVLMAANKLWPDIEIYLAKAQVENFGVKNAYTQPEKLGVDRWLGMIAAYHQYQTALCVVGCGTAVAVDMINASGQHLGGLICPGVRLMHESLWQKTENLGMVSQDDFPAGLANFTEAAIHNGVLLAISGLIARAMDNQDGHFKLLLTGGDAPLIAPLLTTPSTINDNLVLSGLALTLSKPS